MTIVEYDCSRREYRAGLALMAAAVPQAKKKRRSTRSNLVGWILFVVLAVIFFALMRTRQPASRSTRPAIDDTSFYQFWGFYLSLAGVLVFFVGVRLIRYLGWRTFRDQAKSARFSFGPEGIVEAVEDITTQYNWSHYKGFADDGQIIVIRKRNGQGVIFPLRIFNSEQAAEVRALLTANLAIPTPSLVHGFEVKTA